MFTYSGAHICGKDSIIYLRVRKDLSDDLSEDNLSPETYYGTLSDLILYNGINFEKLNLPYFQSHFSAFNIRNKTIYYWGFDKQYKLIACKYNLLKKHITKIDLETLADGTDFFAHYGQPNFNSSGNIEFVISEKEKYWIIDPKFEKIIDFKVPDLEY